MHRPAKVKGNVPGSACLARDEQRLPGSQVLLEPVTWRGRDVRVDAWGARRQQDGDGVQTYCAVKAASGVYDALRMAF